MLEKGKGVDQNIEQALQWYHKSYENGYPFGREAIDKIYFQIKENDCILFEN